jgi:hypothetical protein
MCGREGDGGREYRMGIGRERRREGWRGRRMEKKEEREEGVRCGGGKGG